MNTIIFLTIFCALSILYVVLGIRASKKVSTATDYFIANRQLGIWQISSNLIATQLGGGMLLGTAASAYAVGYYGILYTLGMALGFILLSCGVASRLQQFNVTTTAQLFETQYNSPTLKKIASILSMTTLFGILIAQVVGFKCLMISIGFGSALIILPFWLSVIAYTMIGGLRAITINDMVQLLIIIVTFVGIFFYFLLNEPSSFFSLASLIGQQNTFGSEQISINKIISVILMPALFSLIEQDLAQRFFASKSKVIATISAFNAAIFLSLFAFIPVYLGMKAKEMDIILLPGANPLLSLLTQTVPDIIFAFAVCAIIAAIISTADALMNGISANITQDFEILEKNNLTISKITTAGVGLAALIASYFVPQNIIDILINSYELSVSCLLIPLLFCYFKKDVNKSAAIISIIFGFIGFILFRIYAPVIPKEILTLGLSLLGYCLGSYIKK
jgi:SSS family solute:Na+ symporter